VSDWADSLANALNHGGCDSQGGCESETECSCNDRVAAALRQARRDALEEAAKVEGPVFQKYTGFQKLTVIE
jgi:hypothetical protein